MKKMYKKPEIETTVLRTRDLMLPGNNQSPTDGSIDPHNQAPGRNSGTSNPY